jgi:hypothetical protein
LVVRDPECAGIPSVYGKCHAVHPATYVTGRLAKDLELLEFIPGTRSVGSMDFYLLRKPARGLITALDEAQAAVTGPPRF